MTFAPFVPKWKLANLPPSTVIVDRCYQPREQSLNLATVGRYVSAMRGGDVFPPINVARVGRKLFVVDGFHRLAAATQLGLSGISSLVAKLRHEQAVTFAIAANTSHGLQLSREDKKRSFTLYRLAGLHLKPDGAVKSLRTIERELGKIAWPNTIRAWLKEAAIEPGEPESEDDPVIPWSDRGPDGDEVPEHEAEIVLSMTTRIDALIADFHCLESPESRALVHARLQAADDEWRKRRGPEYFDI